MTDAGDTPRKPVRIVYLEDDPSDAEIIKELVEEMDHGLRASIEWLSTKEAFLAALKQPALDLILCDFLMPGYDGNDAFRDAKALRPDVPFIMLTGHLDEDRAIETLKQGVTDYILKDNLKRLVVVINRALAEAEIERQRKQVSENEVRLKALLDHNPSLVFMKDEEGRYVYLNDACERQFALTKDWLGKTDFDFWPKESAEMFRANDMQALKLGQIQKVLEDSTDLQGNRHCWLAYKFPFTDANGRRFLGGIGIDATDHVRAQEALRENLMLMLNQASDAMMVVDIEGNIDAINEPGLRLLGYQDDELTGKKVSELAETMSRLQTLLTLEELRQRAPEPLVVSVRVRNRAGQLQWLSVTASLVSRGTDLEKYFLKFSKLELPGVVADPYIRPGYVGESPGSASG